MSTESENWVNQLKGAGAKPAVRRLWAWLGRDVRQLGLDSQLIGIIVGTILIAAGLDAFAGQLLGGHVRLAHLGVGLGLLFAWQRTERWVLLVAGALLLGGGLGLAVGSSLQPRWSNALLILGMGAGFFLISRLSKERRTWTLLAGGIFVFIGLLRAAVPADLIVPNELAKLGFPLLLVGTGLVLLLQKSIGRRGVWSLVGVAVVSSVFLPATRKDTVYSSRFPEVTHRTFIDTLPPLDGRSLTINANRASVILYEGSSFVESTVRAFDYSRAEGLKETARAKLDVSQTSEAVTITPRTDLLRDSNYQLFVHIPRVPVKVIAKSGGVVSLVDLPSLDIATEAGDLTIVGSIGELRVNGQSASGKFYIGRETKNAEIVMTEGSAQLSAAGDPKISIQSTSGRVLGPPEFTDDQRTFERAGAGGTVRIFTERGNVVLRAVVGSDDELRSLVDTSSFAFFGQGTSYRSDSFTVRGTSCFRISRERHFCV